MLGVSLPAFAQRERIDGEWNSPKCINAVWKWTIPTEKEKEFDLKNDLDIDDTRYSCDSEISPSEINRALTIIKQAIKGKNKEKLADIVVYPFSYWIKTKEKTEYGFKADVQANNKIDFIKHYDEIITKDVERVIECSALNNMRSLGGGAVALASDFIFLTKAPNNNKEHVRYFRKYPLRFKSMRSYTGRHVDWFEENCK